MEEGHTERLRIVPIGVEHAVELLNIFDDPRVGAHIGEPRATSSAKYARRFQRWIKGPSVDSGEAWFNWVVMLAQELIGQLHATTYNDVAEVAYLSSPARRRNGYATEATT